MRVHGAPRRKTVTWRVQRALHVHLGRCLRLAQLVVVACGLILGCFAGQANGADEPPNGKLGIGVFIGPGEDANGDGLEKTNRLWFALDPGSSASRPITVSSSSSITQTITMGTIAGSRENGGDLSQQPDREDPIGSWVTFSPKEFELAPGASREVAMTVTVPQGAASSVNENYVSVRARKTAESTAQYRIPTAIQFVQRMMVTVGNADDLRLNFDIIDVEGFKGDDGPSLRIYFDNTGGVPVSLAGSTQLSSIDFEGVRSDNYSFLSGVILPGDSGYADVLVSDPVAAGRWRVFVSAYQGSTEKTATFERDLTFDGPPRGAHRPFSIDFQKILLLLIALALLVGGIRTIRSGGGKDGEVSLVNGSTSDDSNGNAGSSPVDDSTLARNFVDGLTVLRGTVASRTARLRSRLRDLASDEAEGSSGATGAKGDGGTQSDSGDAGEPSSDSKPGVGGVDKNVGEALPDSAPGLSPQPQGLGDQSKDRQSFKVSANALRELKKLLDEGVISQEEFERKRKEILKRF